MRELKCCAHFNLSHEGIAIFTFQFPAKQKRHLIRIERSRQIVVKIHLIIQGIHQYWTHCLFTKRTGHLKMLFINFFYIENVAPCVYYVLRVKKIRWIPCMSKLSIVSPTQFKSLVRWGGQNGGLLARQTELNWINCITLKKVFNICEN